MSLRIMVIVEFLSNVGLMKGTKSNKGCAGWGMVPEVFVALLASPFLSFIMFHLYTVDSLLGHCILSRMQSAKKECRESLQFGTD